MKRAILALALGLVATLGLAPAASASPTFDELFAWVDYLDDKYGTGVIWVDVAELGPGVYAGSRGNQIIFNSRYVDDRAALDAGIASDVVHGYHPGGNCTSTQLVAAHEVGHVLDWATGYTARYELAAALDAGLTGTVSGYSFAGDGSVDIPEALANALVAVECGSPTPAELYIYSLLTS